MKGSEMIKGGKYSSRWQSGYSRCAMRWVGGHFPLFLILLFIINYTVSPGSPLRFELFSAHKEKLFICALSTHVFFPSKPLTYKFRLRPISHISQTKCSLFGGKYCKMKILLIRKATEVKYL